MEQSFQCWSTQNSITFFVWFVRFFEGFFVCLFVSLGVLLFCCGFGLICFLFWRSGFAQFSVERFLSKMQMLFALGDILLTSHTGEESNTLFF